MIPERQRSLSARDTKVARGIDREKGGDPRGGTLGGHEHHESAAVANVVVGQAESCLLRGIYGSQLDGYAVQGCSHERRRLHLYDNASS